MGQFNGERLIRTASSPAGNYLYLLGTNDSSSSRLNGEFIIEKIVFDPTKGLTDTIFRPVGTARPVASEKELRKYFSEKDIDEMVKNLSLSSRSELVNSFRTPSPFRVFGLYYTAIETRMALGEVYFDDKVKKGEIAIYKVWVNINGSKQPWGVTVMESRAGNKSLSYFKPAISEIKSFDSLVIMVWKMPVNRIFPDSFYMAPSIVKNEFAVQPIHFPLSPQSIRAKVKLKQKGQWTDFMTLEPVLNKGSDTINYIFIRKTTPGEQVAAFLVTEDEVYNKGNSSDTAYTYAIEQKSIPMIYGIRVVDILDGIRLSWDPLPRQGYVSGIEILRYDSDDKLDSVTVLNPSDTSYIDYAIQPGQNYRYHVKALFQRTLAIEQKVPATGAGTYTKFSRPLPPQDLQAFNSGRNIQLKWRELENPSLFAYYVYRGTSPHNLKAISGVVKSSEYQDTADFLNARATYYYAVISQNLRQDTSIFSNIVSIVPNRKIITSFPTDIIFYYANGKLHISWKDVRDKDNAIESFVVQKKLLNQNYFSTISPQPLIQNSIEDSLISEGDSILYRVAAITYRGDTSEFSEPSKFILPKKGISAMNIFFLKNDEEGINISWPEAEYNDRKSYTIFRREASSQNFIKLTEVDTKTFWFIDKTVKLNAVYVYAISVTATDGRQSEMGRSLSIRREIQQSELRRL